MPARRTAAFLFAGSLLLVPLATGCTPAGDGPPMAVPSTPASPGPTTPDPTTPDPTTPDPTTPEPSGADTDGPDDAFAVEALLDEAAARVDQGREDVDVPGLGGISYDVEGRALDVYWVGEPPSRVTQLATRPPEGISVRVHRASYDLASMVKATERLDQRYGKFLHEIAPSPEGAGLTVGQTAEDEHNGPTPAEMSRAAGMPVTAEITDAPEAAEG